MRRSIRGMMAGLLTMGSLSIFSLSATLPAHAAQLQPMDACPYVQITTNGAPTCVPSAALPQHFTNVTQVCNMDVNQPEIVFVDEETSAPTYIPLNQCTSFHNQAGTVEPA